MQKKTLYLLFILSLALTMSQAAFAQDAITPSRTLFNQVQTAFDWGIGLAAALAGISFLIGATQYMFFAQSDGKDRMLNSVFGLLICFASIVILKQVNPQIIAPINIVGLPSQGGLFFVKDNGDKAPAPFYFVYDADFKKLGYKQLLYDCGKSDPAKTMRIIVRQTAISGYVDDGGRIYQRGCGETFNIMEGWATAIDFEYPGVYFYAADNCSGKDNRYAGPYNNSVSSLPANLIGHVKCMIMYTAGQPNGTLKVMTSYTPNIVAGSGINAFILAGEYQSNKEGERTPIQTATDGKQHIQSAVIFRLPDDPLGAGNYVTFHSSPNAQTSIVPEKEAGRYTVEAKDVDKNGKTLDTEKDMKFIYPARDDANPYQQQCKTVKNCPLGTLDINGYFAVTYRAKTKDDHWRLKVFFESNSNLANSDALDLTNTDFTSVTIQPVAQ